jgi:hypothetical protein
LTEQQRVDSSETDDGGSLEADLGAIEELDQERKRLLGDWRAVQKSS